MKGGSLQRDESGGVLIVGLFATAFLVGVLYMLVGAGTALQHGQQMQDAADSAAFMFAQMHAKGMNLIALLNMIKLSALAIIVAPAALIVGAEQTIETIESNPYTASSFSWAVPLLSALSIAATLVYYQAAQRTYPVMKTAHKAQKLLIRTLPIVAQKEMARELEDYYAPPVERMISVPLGRLPVSFEPRLLTCARAFPFGFLIIVKATDQFLPPSPPQDLARAYSAAAFPKICMAWVRRGAQPKLGTRPGGEDFQVRTFVTGQGLSKLGESGIGVATWGRQSGASEAAIARDKLSKISFAQAEYFYDGRVRRLGALWSMKWRARLRRFSLGGSVSWPIIH